MYDIDKIHPSVVHTKLPVVEELTQTKLLY